MKSRKLSQQVTELVNELDQYVSQNKAISRDDFNKILERTVNHVHRYTKINKEEIIKKTSDVIAGIAEEYDALSDTMKDRSSLISYIYMKYLKELKRL